LDKMDSTFETCSPSAMPQLEQLIILTVDLKQLKFTFNFDFSNFSVSANGSHVQLGQYSFMKKK
jgi:hypothetical protein